MRATGLWRNPNTGCIVASDEWWAEQNAVSMWACGAPQSFRQVKNKFTHSLETISRKFTKVLKCVMQLAFYILRPTYPHFDSIHPKLQEARFWPHFKDCIGAINGTHIPVTVPLHEQPKYIGRHGYASQNVMAVSDFDMRFIFVVTGCPGSVHDSRVLLDTLVTYKQQFPHPPEGKYYLVDSGYPNKKGYLTPYKGQRYHVSEWQHGRTPVGFKEVFNNAHSSLRNVIERDNSINDAHFQSNIQEEGTDGPESSLGEGSVSGDDMDMSALRDAIATAMVG
ncbi:protein ALP1-like [Miscanthus floridulus]|uniref:protein ALP1-like n=1 Tax=Miscanthus floridulus TaxID=154761 RepID=UPI00345A8673